MGRRAPKTPRRRLRRRIIRWLVLVPALLFSVAIVGIYLFSSVPEPRDIAVVQSASVLDHEGRFVGRLSAEADRVSVDLDQMPQHLRDAVVAVEDHRFYQHRGISPVSIARAAVLGALGRGRQGGSTITQQFVKNAYVGNQRSLWRKVKEGVLSIKLEQQRTKDQILEDYLNTIYFGRGTYGVQSASRAYFGKPASDLKIEESALLAGIIRSPETYEPSREPALAKQRRDVALRLMADRGYLDGELATRLQGSEVVVRPRRVGGFAPHYLEDVRIEVEKLVGANALYGGDITVHVALDVVAQRAAEDAVAAVYDRIDDPEVALVSIDPADGGVRAMVGAREYGRRQLNLALTRRQPGSTFKMAVLAEAFREGVSPSELVEAPGRRTFQLKNGPWEVETYDGKGHGTIPLARATELSVNTTFAKLIIDLGPDKVAELARDLGVRRDLPAHAALALGAVEVSPLELASMYATIAARGTWSEPFLVEKVTGEGGKVLYRHDAVRERVLDRQVADEVAWVLKGVIDDGTGGRARIGREAAGKTGTTQDFRDAWFAGFTPSLAAVVWNGYAEGGRFLRNVRGRDVTGGSFPAEIWRGFMKGALESTPAERFVRPASLEEPEPSPTPTPTGSTSPSGSSSASAVPSALPSKTPETVPTASPAPSISDRPRVSATPTTTS